jgi:hypothetical protein
MQKGVLSANKNIFCCKKLLDVCVSNLLRKGCFNGTGAHSDKTHIYLLLAGG